MGTEIFSNINWLSVLAAGAAYFFLGAIWYSFLFKDAWIRYSGVNVNDPNLKKGVAQTMLASFILMLVASLGIVILLANIQNSDWKTGAKLGLLTGVCFSATAISISYLYEKKPLGLHLINGGYHVVGCIVSGIVLAIWN